MTTELPSELAAELAVRRATTADVDALAPLFDRYRQFYMQPADLERAAQFVAQRLHNGESVVFLALAGPVAVGFCQLYPTFCSVTAAPILVLYDLFVAPGGRQSGVGRALMRAAQDYALGVGAARMDLSTAKTNLAAQALYESEGWQRDQEFFTYSRSL